MSLSEDKLEKVRKIRELISRISSGSTDKLIREVDLGTVLSFRPAEESLNGIFEIVNDLSMCDIKKIPYKKLDQIYDQLNPVLELIANIYNYSPNVPGIISREGIIERSEQVHNNLYNVIVPILYYTKALSNNLEIEQQKISTLINSIELTEKEISEKKETSLKEVEEILKNLREAASESGVTKYSEVFANEATENKRKANHWLIAVVVFGIISIGIAYLFLTVTPNVSEISNYEIVHFALTKIIVFTILYYLLLLFVRNYNAQRHNYIINKHRQNALTTFGTFVSSTKDNDTKNAVLLQTTHSIFASQSSGYLKSEHENEPAQKLIEIIRAGNGTLNHK